jgi:quercetin dioxygenase-like cupin family protein
MSQPFPEPILNLPQADIPLAGVTAYLSQAPDHQILFMHFSEDVELGEHAHEAQWGIVLEGSITMTINAESTTYAKGERYFIPAGVKHSAKIHAGYADMTYFNEAQRYDVKETGEA